MSNTIETLELEIVSNSQSASKGIDALTQSLKNLKSATTGLGLKGVASGIGDIGTAMQKVKDANDSTSKAFSNLSRKITSGTRAIVSFGKTLWSAIKQSSDYTETLHLFEVAMGQYADGAKEYAEIVSDAMGIDTEEWMKAQGVFMTLATGFGVASDRASVMSKNLTQLSYDLSSFYNMDVDKAFLKLKSGLAGELEPLRAIGYDLSQAKLEATALELGIDKAVSAMTQAEKAELRYYAIMTQVTQTHGDMAKTLDQPANQLRVLKAEFNMAAREIGNIFIPVLNAVLPPLIAATKVIGILANTVAGLFGAKKSEDVGTDKVVESTDQITENLEQSKEEAKKLKSYMLGFDELNVINPNTDAAEDSSGLFDFDLPEYDFMADLVESKVNTIVEEMKEWLGITDDIDNWSELFHTRLGHILEYVGLIGVALLGWEITTTTQAAITAISKLMSSPVHAITIAVTLTLLGVKISINGMKSAIEDGLDGFNFAEIIGGTILTAGGAALLGSKIVTWIGKVGSTKLVFALAELGKNLGVGTAGALGAAIGGAITGIILGIPAYFVGIYDACVEGIDWLNSLLIGAAATAAGAGIGTIIGMLGGPIGAGIGALIGLAVGLVTDLVILIVQNWEEISAWFGKVAKWFDTKVIKPTSKFFKGLWKDVSGFFKNLWVDIIGIWNTVATWFNDNVISPVVEFFKGLWESVSSFFVNLWDGIKTLWITVATWFNDNVIQPIINVFAPIVEWISTFLYGCWLIIQAVGVTVVNFFRWLGETIAGFFVGLWNGIVEIWQTVADWFNGTVIIPVVNFFKWLWESVSGFFISLWNGIVEVWGVVAMWFNETVIIPVVDFFRGLWETISGFFKSLWEGIKTIWTESSKWFNESVVIPTIYYFKEVWTSVSGFFVSLWTGIKSVWKSVATWFNDTIITPLKTAFEIACNAISGFFSSLWLGVRQGVASAMNGVISAIESALNWILGGINKLIGGFNAVVQWAADVLGADWGGLSLLNEVTFSRVTVPTYAEGAYDIPVGQMFIAREAGAEMVGNIGRKTAVANNDQIVAGIAGGVAEANEEQNALLREQNSLLRAILEKDSGVYLDGKNLANSVEKYQRERGRMLVTGGVL